MRNFLIVLGLISCVGASSAAGDELRSNEHLIESAEGIGKLSVRSMAFAGFSYRAAEGAEDFRLNIVRIVHTGDREVFDRVAKTMRVTLVREGNTLVCRFENPKKQLWGFFTMLFGIRKWKYEVEITGPAQTALSLDAAFSSIDIGGMDGDLEARIAFSNAKVREHRGRVDVNLAFSSIDTEGIEGSFGIDLAFSNANFDMAVLQGDSWVKTAFGSAKLRLPDDTGADISIKRAFGGVDFDLDREPEGGGAHRIIGEGGPHINIDIAFSGVNVRNR